ncbi:MAG TPA: DUF6049 family protein [Jatrophihabitans sp.]|nr:DUF6049 family protein [Jatrophihabitans sp.]
MRASWRGRAGALLAAAGLLLLAAPATPSAAAPLARSKRTAPVTITVDSTAPIVPAPTQKPTPISFRLTVTNHTDAPLANVHLTLQRGDPISTQRTLDQALAGHGVAAGGGTPAPASKPLPALQLPAAGSVTATFTTTTFTSTDYSGQGICLCAQIGIYPLTFTATDSIGQELGSATTFLPSAYAKPPQVQVGWLWPLLERPHRLGGSSLFTDDDLAGSVAPNGRLARALDVVSQLGADVPLTLVVDPELLDELEVMTGPYTVESGRHRLAGTGQEAAATWLAQLASTLSTHPNVQITLTPYADPDVEALTRHHLNWSAGMPAAMADNVTKALAGRTPDTTLDWPAGGAVSQATLDALSRAGVTSVVLGSTAVTPRADAAGVPAGAVQLAAAGTDIVALLTSSTIEKYAGAAVTLNGSGAAALPALLAELSVRVAQEPATPHTALITPPRYVNPDVAAAVAAITTSSGSLFTRPASVTTLERTTPVPRGRLTKVPASAATLPSANLHAAETVQATLPAFSAMFAPSDPNARAVLTNLPIALQRIESSAWYGQRATAAGRSYAAQLTRQIDAIKHGVRIVRPSSGSYTLASSNSPLPITVENDLPYPVTVKVSIKTINGQPGFTARETAQLIEAHSKRTVHVPTSVERSGRIQVQAELLSPTGMSLGSPVQLTVHSTALGVIGIVITIVAGAVLVLALLVRFLRRMRARRRRPPQPTVTDQPAPVSVP